MKSYKKKHMVLENLHDVVEQIELEFRWWMDGQQDIDILSILDEEITDMEECLHQQEMSDLELEANVLHHHLHKVIDHEVDDSAEFCTELFLEIKKLEEQVEFELSRDEASLWASSSYS